MKCRSVACIWSGSPPLQKVTATAVLNRPPTLYTGGSDGSIVWWNLSGTESNQEIKPVAMLCGHAAPIADLDICNPVVASGDRKVNDSSDVATSSASAGALISACTDGVLCIWSRGSGQCRCRRKMPPWVGSPSVVQVLPTNQRYACIACSFIDALNLHEPHSISNEGGKNSVGRESHYRKPSKCTVVIVDTYALTIVQTVFHGNLSIGPLMFMALVSSIEEREEQVALMVDSIGKVQFVPISNDVHPDGEGETGLQRSYSHMDMTLWADGLSEGEQVVSISVHGQIVAFVYRTCSVFRLMASGTIIGEISFKDSCLCFEGNSRQSHVVGGMFLENNDASGNTPNARECREMFSRKFAAWNGRGTTIVYIISYLDDLFNSEPLFEIPAVAHGLDMGSSICIAKMNCYLLRTESRCIHVEESLLWRPLVTIWSLSGQHDDQGLCRPSKMLGEGSLNVDWITKHTGDVTESNSQRSSVSSTNYVNSICGYEDGFVQKGQFVSSSMVISENHLTPYAVVYGFYSGQIEVVRFDMFFQELNSKDGSTQCEVDSHVYKQCFPGHTGAVLCLAAHRVVGSSKGCSYVLLSGGMDSTIRIWDLRTGNLITVMHQHVAPVRQIILPPARTERPWSDCFLSIGEDSCVGLASLETMRVERVFPGHPNYPAKVVWDGARGYIACLCQNYSRISDSIDVLYIWDIKTGARERVLRGTASHSVFDNFCKGINMNSISGSVLNGNTSVSSLHLPVVEDASFSQFHLKKFTKGVSSSNVAPCITNAKDPTLSQQACEGKAAKQSSTTLSVLHSSQHSIKCSCPFPGIVSLGFDLALLMSSSQKLDLSGNGGKQVSNHMNEHAKEAPSPHNITEVDHSDAHETLSEIMEEQDCARLRERCLLRFSISFLHLWGVDYELDNLLITDMKLKRPEKFVVASGLQGDRGSLTLTFPGLSATLELWKSSLEFSAMRSLTMVSLAQRMISLSQSSISASSALAAFYTRNFAERIPAIKPPLLQLLVSFWQVESEHVRMAARSLFHCAASRAIPLPLCSQKATDHPKHMSSSVDERGENEHKNANIEELSISKLDSEWLLETPRVSQAEESKILAWLESYEMQDWISCVGGTSQDAMASHIIVAGALAIWYPSLVKPSLAVLVVHPLIKLVMAMNEKYSSTAAELLAEGMESTWTACIGPEIPRLIGDIFFQIECVSGASANLGAQNPAVPDTIQETLVEILLPSLAIADIPGFLTVIESQIWSTASDSPVHLISLTTLIRIVRGSPRNLVQYLDKAVNFILQTIDPGNSVMRKTCLKSSMTALKEVARVFPMVALNDTLSRLAVGDGIGDVSSANIRVYDMQSVTKIKILDASGPPGLPSLLAGASDTMVTTAISALSFSPDGEGLVAFSEHGLMIRWWSLGSAWWEKLSRNLVPVQCTKLIFVPPWEGFSPNSFRSSIMASIMGHDRQANLQENIMGLSDVDNLKLLIHNLDLSYRLEWAGERKVLLARHDHELGSFPL